jgi:hypothetical protein
MNRAYPQALITLFTLLSIGFLSPEGALVPSSYASDAVGISQVISATPCIPSSTPTTGCRMEQKCCEGSGKCGRCCQGASCAIKGATSCPIPGSQGPHRYGALSKDDAARGPGRGRGNGCGGQCGRTAQASIGAATIPSFQEVRGDFQHLIHNHDRVVRSVEEVPQGVRSTTLTSDPSLLPILRKHPREIRQHLEAGGRVRMWDPLFAEMIRQQKHIHMAIREIENGVEVTTTADHPEVVKLVRAHAAKVTDFVRRGPEAAHQETRLPEGYVAPQD